MATNNTISRINGKRGVNSPNSYTNIIHVFSQEITQPKGRISYLRTHLMIYCIPQASASILSPIQNPSSWNPLCTPNLLLLDVSCLWSVYDSCLLTNYTNLEGL